MNNDLNTQPSKSSTPAILAVCAVVAALIGLGAFLLFGRHTSTTNSDHAPQSTSRQTTSSTASKASNKVIATQQSSAPGLYVDLYEPVKSGDTLILNYKIYNKDSDRSLFAYPTQTGLFQVGKDIDVPEPYVVSDADGQKYGLVRDEAGQILASKVNSIYLEKGKSISGYATVSLPPNDSVVSVSLGSMPNFSGVTIKY